MGLPVAVEAETKIEAGIADRCASIAVARLDERIRAFESMLTANENRSIERLNDRIRAVTDAVVIAAKASESALRVATVELNRHLGELNNEGARLKEASAKTVQKEVFDSEVKSLQTLITNIRLDFREQQGKLWLPMLIVSGLAAGLAAAIMRLVT